MRDRDRELWSVGPGRFLSHSDGPHSLSLQRLDALLYTQGKNLLSFKKNYLVLKLSHLFVTDGNLGSKTIFSD